MSRNKRKLRERGAEELVEGHTQERPGRPVEDPPRQRREHRLIPEEKPLDWFSSLEKYTPV